ncbi:PREDICTED: putative methyltransferase DDB_G0268948 [Crocodylus porosus]|uniref:Putative methyltransferase DDB_G0268948 n=1 Tax=Crocodylus porosus TaxID=8502 RepID=A0A7M4EBN3_CROPO|nr:PREDICTED: putative methyltransferase DDB_G0268948 [Crocodylus porosus]
MAANLFEGKAHAAGYQRYRLAPPPELQQLLLAYLRDKRTSPVQLAVDIGCGSGQGTRVLAAHFEKVIGIDISEAQIEEAKQANTLPNVSYCVSSAEQLPFEDGSVDLITAFVAAHWFDLERFMKELDRVLRPNGCVAFSTYTSDVRLQYKDCSEKLTEIFSEAVERLSKYRDERVHRVLDGYKEIYASVPFKDKKRVTDIFGKLSVSVADVIGYFQTFSMYQTFLRSDPEKAKALLLEMEQRFLETMGVPSNETQLELWVSNVCVLGHKGP